MNDKKIDRKTYMASDCCVGRDGRWVEQYLTHTHSLSWDQTAVSDTYTTDTYSIQSMTNDNFGENK